uniref:Uncharacterized protein n=1 Tax=Alexandrium monilatum TaxID=311494 RepID=A0A7S4V9C6_9DINO
MGSASIQVDAPDQDASEADEQAHTYKLEENLYGLLVVRASPPVLFALLIFYLIALGITSIISVNIIMRYGQATDVIADLCTWTAGMWDCRPPRYEDLLDLSRLDTNGDGRWSVAEARKAGLLQQFQGLHEFVLGTPELLAAVAPPREPQINPLCYAAHFYPVELGFLSDREKMDFAASSGHLSDTVRAACSSAQNGSASLADCLYSRICPESHRTLATRPQTSRESYVQMTRAVSVFPAPIYRRVRAGLTPCRLAEPALCANAELKGLLAGVPMWSFLDPEERASQCEAFVREECPKLFGSSYARFQVKLDGSCGDRKFAAREVPVLPPKPSVLGYAGDCRDNNTKGREAISELVRVMPLLRYLLLGSERMNGLPPGALLHNADCSLAFRLQLCNHFSRIGDTDFLQVVGQHCPDTCCRSWEAACPAQCAVGGLPKTSTPLGDLTCVGRACGKVETEEDNSSGVVVLRGGGGAGDVAKVIIHTEMELRVQLLRLDVGSADDVSCLDGALHIDGRAYCTGRKPEVLKVPRREGGIVEMQWSLADRAECHTPCGWELILTDAGESNSYSISEVAFKGVHEYSDIVHPSYRLFFYLILYLWTGYILVEVRAVFRFTLFIANCPDFPGSRSKRTCLLAGACLPRLLLALWVYGVGCVLLIAAPDYVDVVLNSVALAFILDVDEIMFAMSVPSALKREVTGSGEFRWGTIKRKWWRVPSFGMVSLMLVPVLPSLFLLLFQYSWGRGFSTLSTQKQCACHLQGSLCLDAVF